MNIVKKQIEEMIHTDGPYFPPPADIYRTVTDINEWPYPRMFRGDPRSSEPIIWDREAGYQKIIHPVETPSSWQPPFLPNTPNLCFQIPCSTILPCKSQENTFQSPTNQCVYRSP
jgi:hypothetical protein